MPPGENDEPYRCPNCGRELKTVAGFRRHLERHVQPGSGEWLSPEEYSGPWMDRP